MTRLRAKKAAKLPNDGKGVIDSSDIAEPTPFHFAKDGESMSGDPSLAKTDVMTANYDELAAMMASGVSPKTLLAPKAKPAAESVKVR